MPIPVFINFIIKNLKNERICMSFLSKISKFFKKSDVSDERTVVSSENPNKIEEIGDIRGEVVQNDVVVQMYLGGEENKLEKTGEKYLLGDLTSGENRAEMDANTIAAYRKRVNKRKKALAKVNAEITERVYNVNELFMMERYGIKLTKRTNLMLPGFMSGNFSGFFVGKSVDTNKMYVFAGSKDVYERRVTIGGGKSRPISYNMLNQWVGRGGEPIHGYVWFKVKDNDILRRMLAEGEFEDDASRVWLEDYFAYVEFVAAYRVENPDIELNLIARYDEVIKAGNF